MIVDVNGKSFEDSPIWWQNFIIWFDEKYNDHTFGTDHDRDKKLNNELSHYMAHMILEFDSDGDSDIAALEFTTEAHANWFILKWS